MESLDYYLSIPLDPWTENNYNTQEDTTHRGAVQYKLDSITDTLGTHECGQNIDLFYNEVILEIDDDQMRNFYQTTLKNLIELYDLDVLDQDQMDRYPSGNMEDELRQILIFFEKNKWIEYMVRNLPLDKPKLVYSPTFRDYLNLHYKLFIDNMLKNENLPYLIGKYFAMASKYDCINTMMRLVNAHKNELATEFALKLEGKL